MVPDFDELIVSHSVFQVDITAGGNMCPWEARLCFIWDEVIAKQDSEFL